MFEIFQLPSGQTSTQVNEQLGWLSIPTVILLAVLILSVAAVGVWIWRLLYTSKKVPDSLRRVPLESSPEFKRSAATEKMHKPDKPLVPPKPKRVFASADTVENRDDENVEESLSRFSSQLTVDETADTSLFSDSKNRSGPK